MKSISSHLDSFLHPFSFSPTLQQHISKSQSPLKPNTELHQYILISYDTFKKKRSILQISTTATVFLDKRLQSIRICYYLASTVWLFVREEPFSPALLSVLPLPRLGCSGSRVPAVVDLQIVRSASDGAPANVQR